MFHLTWKEYLIFLGGALAVYYLYIGLSYYRKELMALLRGTGKTGAPQPPSTIDPAGGKKRIWQFQDVPEKNGSPFLNAPGPGPSDDPLARFWAAQDPATEQDAIPAAALEDGQDEEEVEEMTEMEALEAAVSQIRDLFSETGQTVIDKGPLLESLRSELETYPNLAVQPYKIAINNLIATEAKERFGMSLNQRELETIWPKTG